MPATGTGQAALFVDKALAIATIFTLRLMGLRAVRDKLFQGANDTIFPGIDVLATEIEL